MIFGLGALLGLSFPPQIDFFVKFLVNMFFAGALYVVIWAVIAGIKNRHKIQKNIKKTLKNKRLRKVRYFSAMIVIISLIILYFTNIDKNLKMASGFMFIMLYFMNYAIILIKAIEEAAMIKNIDPKKLTEGDWIVNEIKIKGRYITGPKELGIKKDQIKKLIELKEKGKIKTVKVKYGIPFIPSFLIAIIYTILANNIALLAFI